MLGKEVQTKWKKLAPTIMVISILLLSSSLSVAAKNNKSLEILQIDMQGVQGGNNTDVFATIFPSVDYTDISIPDVAKKVQIKGLDENGSLLRVDNLKEVSIVNYLIHIHFSDYPTNSHTVSIKIWIKFSSEDLANLPLPLQKQLSYRTIKLEDNTTIEKIPNMTTEEMQTSLHLTSEEVPYGEPGTGGYEISTNFPYVYSYASGGSSDATIGYNGVGHVFAAGGYLLHSYAFALAASQFVGWFDFFHPTANGCLFSYNTLSDVEVYNHYYAYIAVIVMMYEWDFNGNFISAHPQLIWMKTGGYIYNSISVNGYTTFTWHFGHYYRGVIEINAVAWSGSSPTTGSYAYSDFTFNTLSVSWW